MAHFAANYVANLIPGALFHPSGEGGLGKKKKKNGNEGWGTTSKRSHLSRVKFERSILATP